jgi:hypothetical protein
MLTTNTDLATVTALAQTCGATDLWLLRLGRAVQLRHTDIDDTGDDHRVTTLLQDDGDALLIIRFPTLAKEDVESGLTWFDPALALDDPELRAAALVWRALHGFPDASRTRIITDVARRGAGGTG